MSIWTRSVHALPESQGLETTAAAGGRIGWGRLVHIALALYLAPALLVVLLVGGAGLLILAVARAISGFGQGPRIGMEGPGKSL